MLSSLSSSCATCGVLPRAPPPPVDPPAAALQHAQLVYVRSGGASLPLAPQYHRPYRMLSWGPKDFKVQLGDKTEVNTVVHL